MREGLVNISIAGLKSLAKVRLELGPLTVLIGANGSGKSNLLGALSLARRFADWTLQRFVGEAGGAAALLHYGPKRTPRLCMDFEFVRQGQRYIHRSELSFAAGDKLVFADESISGDSFACNFGSGHFESALGPSGEAHEAFVHGWLSEISFFHFHDTSISSALRTFSRPEDDQRLRSDGKNLAAFLLRMSESLDEAERKAWRRINHFVHRVAPGVRELAPTRMSGASVRLDWIDDQGERFGAHQLSDGSLRAIALITALSQPTAQLPRFISIDEPELGLHPAAIAVIAALARAASHHSQLLLATQSTCFLDHFKPSEVVVVEREAGESQFTRLDKDALAAWLEDYSLSEVFDKGVIGGRR